MRGLRLALIMLVLAATPAAAKRPAPPGFAEPGDIIAAEGNFAHIRAAKGVKTAIRETAVPDAEIFAPQLMRVAQYPTPDLLAPWFTGQLWMSCDGSVAVTYGLAPRRPMPDRVSGAWSGVVWKRVKGGSYKWVLELGGPSLAPPPESDMIAARVADCPARRVHAAELLSVPADHKAPIDYTSGHADDATLQWATEIAADGSRTFTVLIKQDAVLHEVLHVTTPAILPVSGLPVFGR